MKQLLVAGLTAAALLGAGAVTLHATGDSVAEARQSAKSVVDAAKARGEVGEVITGYLEVRSGASADVRAAVNEINIGRKALYQRLAREQGVEIAVVAQLTGEKQIAGTAPGQYVKGADGQWRQK